MGREADANWCGDPTPAQGWDEPGVAEQQAAGGKVDLPAWKAGGAHASYDPFANLLSLAKPCSLLEVGCGAGYYAAITDHVWPVSRFVGCDSAPSMIEAAQRDYGHLGEFGLADQRDLSPFADGSFDLVCNSGALLHLEKPFDWWVAIAECARVAERWVMLHRVPIRPAGGWKTTVHQAYGTEISETFAAESQLLGACQERGLKVAATERWNEGVDPEYCSVLLKVGA